MFLCFAGFSRSPRLPLLGPVAWRWLRDGAPSLWSAGDVLVAAALAPGVGYGLTWAVREKVV